MGSPVLACNIKAINAQQRPRYNNLVSRLRAAMRDRSELRDGYEYALDSAKITLPEVAEWITLERLCCPFLNFQIEVAGETWRLTLRGPDGTKAILGAEFPAGGHPSGNHG
jgi:hypothetical protein